MNSDYMDHIFDYCKLISDYDWNIWSTGIFDDSFNYKCLIFDGIYQHSD